MRNFLGKLLSDDRGTTVLEYGFICAGIVIGLIVAVKGVGDQDSGLWATVTDRYTTAAQEARNK